MWFHLSLFLLLGVVVADHKYGWIKGIQYQYDMQSFTLAMLANSKNIRCIYIKGVLTVQVESPDTLIAKITDSQYGSLIRESLEDWETLNFNDSLQFRKFPLTELPFQIKLKEGLIQELLLEQHTWVPTWEVNFLKSIVSQLEVNTQAKNVLINSDETLMPDENQSLDVYKVMEASVGGECEVLYDIKSFSHEQNTMKLDPMLNSTVAQQFMEIRKLKNYNKCEQQRDRSYGFGDRRNLKSSGNEVNDKLSMKFAASDIGIYGNLKRFTIVSSKMKNKIYVKSTEDKNLGNVRSQVELTLTALSKNFETIEMDLEKLRSVGNLVYTDSNSFLFENEYGSQSEQNQYDQNSTDNSNPSKLDEVPNSLAMPFLNDYKNRNIKLIDQPTEAAYRIILKIADEVSRSNNLLFHDTLEKYTTLVNLLQVLNIEQFFELKQRLNINDKQSILRNVFYDAVGQTGTVPALLAIVDWCKKGSFDTVEILQLLTQIPNTVRVPTTYYVKVFFDLISHPAIANKKYVNRVAPVALSELILKSNEFITLNEDITERYILYLETRLAEAVKRDESPLIQTYIAALGSLGNSKILSIFEPYLEGQISVTKYERMLMVRWLYPLAVTNPKAVKNVLSKIYSNVKEAYEVRNAAVYLYLLTNPSLSELTRMAKFTHYEKNEQVNSAVASGIISLSKVNRPDLHLLVENARIARKSLMPKSYDFTYSQIFFTEKSILVTIASEETDVPKSVIYNLNNFYNPQDPMQQVEYAVSNFPYLNQLIKNFGKQERNLEEGKNSLVEKLVEQLNIKFGMSERLKANVFLSTSFGKLFYPFDADDILTLVRWLLLENKYVDFNHFYIHGNIVNFPIESGLMFSQAEEVPTLVKMHVTKNADIAANLKINGELNAVVSGKVQRRFGFSVPFDRQQYHFGTDTNWQVHLPIEYDYEQTLIGPTSERNYELTLQPSRNERIRLLHYSTVPFSTQRTYFDFRPVSSLNLTNIINLPTHGSLSYQRGTIYVAGEINVKQPNKFLNLASQLKQIIYNSNLLFDGKFDVYINNENKIKNNKLHLNVHYKSQEFNGYNNQTEPLTSINDIKDKKPNSKDRQNQILQEVSKDIKSVVKARVYDVSLEIPSILPRELEVFTVGLGNSYMDQKHRAVFYWNRQLKKDEEIQSEGLIIAHLRSLLDRSLYQNLNKALKHTPMSELMINMLIGDENKIINKIQIDGNFTQSDSLREIIMNSQMTQECLQQMRQGKDRSPQCQEAIQHSQIKDNLKLLINTNSEYYKLYADMALKFLSDIMPTKSVKLSNLKNNNTIDLELKISPNYRKAKVVVNTPKMNVTFTTPTFSGVDNSLKEENEVDDPRKLPDSAYCLIERSQVSTFDGKFYNTNLLNNWQIVMVPVVKTGVPENMKAAVMIRRTQDNKLQTLLTLNNHKILLEKLNGTVAVTVDQNNEILFPPNTHHVLKDESTTIAEILNTLQNSIWVWAPKHELFVAYNEYYVAIQLSNKYRNKIRGLCGNYDKKSENDFLTPDNCVMQNPKEFIVTYTLTDNNDQENISNKKWTNISSNCLEENNLLTDVISDREAGRLTSKPVWGYHTGRIQSKNREQNAEENLQKNITLTPIDRSIVEEDNLEICFSLKPVPTCRGGEIALHTQLKEISFNCMPKNAIARKLQWRIEQGANPNLSEKSVSKKENRKVPTTCTVTN